MGQSKESVGSNESLASNASIPLPIPVRTRSARGGSESGYSSDTYNAMTRQNQRELHLDLQEMRMQRLINILTRLEAAQQPHPPKQGQLQQQHLQKLPPLPPTARPYPEPIEDFENESMELHIRSNLWRRHVETVDRSCLIKDVFLSVYS